MTAVAAEEPLLYLLHQHIDIAARIEERSAADEQDYPDHRKTPAARALFLKDLYSRNSTANSAPD